jgi:CRISPR-associated protein Cas1
MGETRSSRRLLHQAVLASSPARRLEVVRRMYELRFPDPLDPGLTLQQIRGKEGIRVRETYARLSREGGIAWSGRSYKTTEWQAADPVNRCLSAANSCLYGVCHAAIVSAGYSPAIGFIHTGKMLSFVYDIGDLYKTEVTLPVAFRIAAEGGGGLEGRVRRACRDAFYEQRMLQRIIPDIEAVLRLPPGGDESALDVYDALAGALWDPAGEVAGGVNYALTGKEVGGDDGVGAGAGEPQPAR